MIVGDMYIVYNIDATKRHTIGLSGTYHLVIIMMISYKPLEQRTLSLHHMFSYFFVKAPVNSERIWYNYTELGDRSNIYFIDYRC